MMGKMTLCSGVLVFASCSGEVTKSDAPISIDAVPAGAITLGQPASFDGEMGRLFDPPSGYDYGIDFSYSMELGQAAHLTIDDSRNYDCEIGTFLMGPSYYLFLEDGSEKIYDYANRSSTDYYAGSQDLNFPGLVPAGKHRLIVRYYADGICYMRGDVTVADHYQIDRHPAYILNSYLTDTWNNDGQSLTLRYSGSFTWSMGETQISGQAVDFSQETPAKLVMKITAVDDALAESFAAGDQLYCIYATELVDGTRNLSLQCSDPNVTTFPDEIGEQATIFAL